jgi:hypothetical protein
LRSRCRAAEEGAEEHARRGRSRDATPSGKEQKTPRRRGWSRSSHDAEASPAWPRLTGPAVAPGEQRRRREQLESRAGDSLWERMESRAGRKQNGIIFH